MPSALVNDLVLMKMLESTVAAYYKQPHGNPQLLTVVRLNLHHPASRLSQRLPPQGTGNAQKNARDLPHRHHRRNHHGAFRHHHFLPLFQRLYLALNSRPAQRGPIDRSAHSIPNYGAPHRQARMRNRHQENTPTAPEPITGLEAKQIPKIGQIAAHLSIPMRE